ncbi:MULTISPECIES: hypothetical protein [Providencia]|uniref:Prophage protein n=1 Tax=Providencia sneebia DSM 19967 TaxID=1141660 RepID=K8WMV2_9GAMM|nr:hypothetical protein OO7_01386 [Providencia sneebia DSM 19967]
MAYNPNFKPVMLTLEQMERIKALQEVERTKSPLKLAPTLNAIARSLVDNALNQMEKQA